MLHLDKNSVTLIEKILKKSIFSVVTKVLRNTYLDKYLILIFDFKIFN